MQVGMNTSDKGISEQLEAAKKKVADLSAAVKAREDAVQKAQFEECQGEAKKDWDISLAGDNTITLREGEVEISFKPWIVTGKDSLLKRPHLCGPIIEWMDAIYADNDGKLPVVMAVGIHPREDRRVAMKKVLARIVRREMRKP